MSDSVYLKKQREIYYQLLDELDNEVIREIMEHPDGDEADQLNKKVELKLKEIGY